MRAVAVILLLCVVVAIHFGSADARACNSCACINASPSESCVNGYCRMSRGTAICICYDGYQGNRCQDQVRSASRSFFGK